MPQSRQVGGSSPTAPGTRPVADQAPAVLPRAPAALSEAEAALVVMGEQAAASQRRRGVTPTGQCRTRPRLAVEAGGRALSSAGLEVGLLRLELRERCKW